MAVRNVLIFLNPFPVCLSVRRLTPDQETFQKKFRPTFTWTIPAKGNKTAALNHFPGEHVPAKSTFVRAKFTGMSAAVSNL